MEFGTAKKLLDQAFDEVWNNKWAAIRVSLVPLFALIALLALVQFSVIRELFLRWGTGNAHIQLSPWMVIADLALVLFTVCYVAVKWHRFVLHPNGPALPLVPTLVYALRAGCFTVGIIFICFIVCMPFLMAAGGGYIELSGFRSGLAQGTVPFLMTILFSWMFYWLYLEVSPSLVDAAIGAKEGAFGSLKRSHGNRRVCQSLSVIITACTGLASFIGIGGLGLPVFLVLTVNVVIYWLAFMISISIVTVYYRFNDQEPELVEDTTHDNLQTE